MIMTIKAPTQFASLTAILDWAGAKHYDVLKEWIIVYKADEEMFYYFVLRDDDYYHFEMTSMKNLADEGGHNV